eukprot:TRINITY_DN5228_c0_g1_i1.p1 TRINITY_DN5228_c0_g1~~TRINITY_DN5228_c0_g1_i1.p1  ORF type:complete len:597 (+),score=226.84 TRINITY_DN5228_c0_g1_i1:525-2315(+)
MNTTVQLANQVLHREYEENNAKDGKNHDFEPFSEPDSPRRGSFSHSFGSGINSKWLQFFAVVSFDLERGQFVESTHPQVNLHPSDARNIAFNSFPDVNLSNRKQDLIWSFQHEFEGNSHEISTKSTSEEPKEVYYATCMFRQEKDESNQRGFLQKSIVLVSLEPLNSFHQLIAFIVGTQFFQLGEIVLEKAIEDVLNWPQFQHGKSFEMKLLGESIQIEVPHTFLSLPTEIDQKRQLNIPKELVFNPQMNTFRGIYKEMWSLWELMLLGEPLLVFGASPTETSDAVLTLLNLISPVSYIGKVHPFFTVQDTSMEKYFNPKHAPKSMILGVTNPHFDSLWNHSKLILSPLIHSKGNRKNSFKKELVSNHKSLLKIDNKSILSMISKENSVEKLDEMLIQHFRALTNSVMAPLERYMASLIPTNRMISIVLNLPQLGEFKEDDFLSSLSSKSSVHKGKSSDEMLFYRMFLRSENFKMWFRIRRSQARTKLMALWLAALENSNLSWHLKDKSEVLIIDFYLKIKENVCRALSRVSYSAEQRERIEGIVGQILTFLPEDVMRVNDHLEMSSPQIHSPPSPVTPSLSPLPTPNPSKILVAG